MDLRALKEDSGQIRRARADDADSLRSLCVESFPYSIKWRSKELGGKWWEIVLREDLLDTWVYEKAEKLHGFVVVVRPGGSGWCQVWDGEVGLPMWVKACLQHPALTVVQAVRALIGVVQRMFCVGHEIDWASNDRGINAHWITLIAVSRAFRGSGVGRGLLTHVVMRVREFKHDSVKLSVDVGNRSAEKVYKKYGFKCVNSTGSCRTLIYDVENS